MTVLRYWREALGVGLIAACVYLYIGWQGAEIAHLKTINKLTAVTGALNRQNDAVKRLAADGERMRAQVDSARSQGQREMDRAKDESDKLRNLEPAGCATPPLVMGADI